MQAKMEKKEQDAIAKKIRRNPAKHAEDMSLITDKNMDGKRGWKRGRFGRPVITMKLDRVHTLLLISYTLGLTSFEVLALKSTLIHYLLLDTVDDI